MQTEYSKQAVKYILASDKTTKRRIKQAIEKIPVGDIKKLQGVSNGYRLRVGDLRILFTIENDIVYIEKILPRGEVYKKV